MTKIPVNFPVSRESLAETGSIATGYSAIQSQSDAKAGDDREKARHLWTIWLLQTVSKLPNYTKGWPVRRKSPRTH
jgi:hypothetical protein